MELASQDQPFSIISLVLDRVSGCRGHLDGVDHCSDLMGTAWIFARVLSDLGNGDSRNRISSFN